MSRIEDLTAMDEGQLRTELHAIQRALLGLRIQLANQATENTAGLGKLRKEIAQIKTVLRQRQIGLVLSTRDNTSASSESSV